MGKPSVCGSFIRCVSAAAYLTLFGCGGTSAPGAATTETPATTGSAGSLVGSAGASAGAGANSTPNGNGSGGSTSAGQPGSGGSVDTSASGGPQGGSAETSGGVDFSHGSRVLIPQRTLPSIHLGPSGAFNDPNGPVVTLGDIDVTTNSQFLDAPIYPRQFDVSFDMSGLFVKDCQVWAGGKFVVATLEVKEDVAGTGAHLKIEQVDGHYRLTHDGPGSHFIRVTGTFQVNHGAETGGSCPALPMGPVEVPIAFTTNIDIRKMGSVKANAPLGCAEGSFMLSGRNYPGTRISLLDEAGQPTRADNVYDSYPLDVIVETEKPAQIAEAGLGLYYDGLIVTGEPQTIRLSTSYGTLFTYQLANPAMIDGWDVKFWARGSQYIKSATYPVAMDSTPAVSPGKVLGATATLKVHGLPVCSPVLSSDFMVGLPTPNVCKVQYENSPDPNPGIPGFLTTFVDPAGTCELDLSVPGSNGGNALSTHLSAILAAAN